MKERKRQQKRAAGMLRQFLRGSRALFLVCMLSSAVSALCDMLSPQIIRLAVDYALGGENPATLHPAVLDLADSGTWESMSGSWRSPCCWWPS